MTENAQPFHSQWHSRGLELAAGKVETLATGPWKPPTPPGYTAWCKDVVCMGALLYSEGRIGNPN